MSEASVVNVGIAGLGRAGWGIHANTLEPMSGKYRVVAVSDPDSGRRQEAKDRFGCEAYAEFDDLIADESVELVVVAAPSHLHEPFSVAALEAGKHALVEKPFAVSLAEADRMIAAGKEAGRVITSSQNYRYSADFLVVKDVLESGLLGKIVEIRMSWHRFQRRWDWQTLKEYGGGELNNSGAHAVDIALLLFGDAEPEVWCRMESTSLYSGDAENHVKIVLNADDAPLIDIEITGNCAYPQDKWLVMGTQGGLRGSDNAIELRYFDPASLPPRPVDRRPTPDRSYNREQFDWKTESRDVPRQPFNTRNQMLYDDLYPTLRGGAPLVITPESVRRQIAVLEKCRELSPV